MALASSEDNAIFVQRYTLNRPVDEKDARAVRKEFDEVLSDLAGDAARG